jgi:hypothetical protein
MIYAAGPKVLAASKCLFDLLKDTNTDSTKTIAARKK